MTQIILQNDDFSSVGELKQEVGFMKYDFKIENPAIAGKPEETGSVVITENAGSPDTWTARDSTGGEIISGYYGIGNNDFGFIKRGIIKTLNDRYANEAWREDASGDIVKDYTDDIMGFVRKANGFESYLIYDCMTSTKHGSYKTLEEAKLACDKAYNEKHGG